jgi:hypothetical protein
MALATDQRLERVWNSGALPGSNHVEKHGQTMVTPWSNHGQNMAKTWSHEDHGHRGSERGRETPARCGQGSATRPRQGSEITRPLALTSVWPFDQYLTKGHAHARVGDWPGRSPRHDGG